MRKYLKTWMPDPESLRRHPWLGRLAPLISHPRLWHLNRHSAAGAIAAGLFCGLIPGPFQMPAAALCAIVFKVNLPLAMATTLYTNPFTLVPLYLLAYEIGSLFVGHQENFSQPPEFHPGELLPWIEAMSTWVIDLGKPLGIGLFVLATVLAVLGYLGVRLAWRIYLLRAWQARKRRRRAQ